MSKGVNKKAQGYAFLSLFSFLFFNYFAMIRVIF